MASAGNKFGDATIIGNNHDMRSTKRIRSSIKCKRCCNGRTTAKYL